MTSDDSYRTLHAADDLALPELKRIYEEAFPQAERKPSDFFNQIVGREDYAIVVAERGGMVIGFAVVFIPGSSKDAALLEYLAVDSTRRSTGVGRGLLHQARLRAGLRPVLIEVESSDDDTAIRRRDFYRRNGFSKVDGFRYLLPLPGAPPMELLVAQVALPVRRTDLARWLEIIYAAVYGVPRDDERLRQMQGAMPIGE